MPASAASSACPIHALHSSRVCGWTTLSQRQVRGSREACQRPSSCSAAAARAGRSGPRGPARSTVSTGSDSTLGACRSTSTRAWSASRTSRSSSARASRRSTCPECGAAKVLKQLSTFAVHGAAKVGAAASRARRASGGGCCGGSCGCGLAQAQPRPTGASGRRAYTGGSMDAVERAAALREYAEQTATCTKCALAAGARRSSSAPGARTPT